MSDRTSEPMEHEDLFGAHVPAALPTHIEAISATPSAKTQLTAKCLLEGGLVPVQAWMQTNKTRNATRVARAREKKEDNGIKQLNLLAPIDLHGLLRSVARVTPEQRHRVETAMAPEQTPTGLQLRQRECQRAISKASSHTLECIERILSQVKNMTPAQMHALEDQKRARRKHVEIGIRILSSRGWRRLLIQWIAGSKIFDVAQ